MRIFVAILLAAGWCAGQTSPSTQPQAPAPNPPFFKKSAKPKDTSHRILTGVVHLPDNSPAQGAVVRLHSQRNDETLAYITQADGKYRFEGLERETVFTLFAEYKGMKSRTRSLTPFDARDDPVIDLALEPAESAKDNTKDKEKKK